ncbi:MAG: nitroreductase family deazaflavin-dependent oxidoreductase [Frankiaceae bacterium]
MNTCVGVVASWPRRLLRRVGKYRWFACVGSRVAHRVDLLIYPRTAGRVRTGPGLPTLLLTTRGRRSGQPRTMPLLYVRDDDAFVVVGSNWGKSDHPGWSANLLADPAATVQVGGQRTSVRAKLVDGPERDGLWARLREVYPPYEAYRERGGRELRMFRLEPNVGKDDAEGAASTR